MRQDKVFQVVDAHFPIFAWQSGCNTRSRRRKVAERGRSVESYGEDRDYLEPGRRNKPPFVREIGRRTGQLLSE
jgi:hypothetical protein